VHACKDDNGFTVNSKEDCIWKSAEKRPPSLSMNYLIGGWTCHDFGQQGIYGYQELLAEPYPLLFIPQIRFLNIRGGCGADEQLPHWA
jgi:hypothetical protein